MENELKLYSEVQHKGLGDQKYGNYSHRESELDKHSSSESSE